MRRTPTARPICKPLTSWKEISAYLGRTERTAQRWEKRLFLPIHRPLGQRTGVVWAFADELDGWLRKLGTRINLADGINHKKAIPAASFRMSIHALPIPAYLFDADRHHFIAANPSFCKLLGYAESELIQMNWTRLFPPGDLRLARKALATESPTSAIIWRFLSRQGQSIPLALRYQRVKMRHHDGQHRAAFIVTVISMPGDRALAASDYYR